MTHVMRTWLALATTSIAIASDPGCEQAVIVQVDNRLSLDPPSLASVAASGYTKYLEEWFGNGKAITKFQHHMFYGDKAALINRAYASRWNYRYYGSNSTEFRGPGKPGEGLPGTAWKVIFLTPSRQFASKFHVSTSSPPK